MSSVKAIALVSTAGALVTGGANFYRGYKARKHIIQDAQRISDRHGGKIPTGGMTKDGKLWDGFTTVESVKKDTGKVLALTTALNTVIGGVVTAAIGGLTLLAKAHIK